MLGQQGALQELGAGETCLVTYCVQGMLQVYVVLCLAGEGVARFPCSVRQHVSMAAGCEEGVRVASQRHVSTFSASSAHSVVAFKAAAVYA